jgi:hypothetical protein
VDDAVDGGAADAVFLGEVGQGHGAWRVLERNPAIARVLLVGRGKWPGVRSTTSPEFDRAVDHRRLQSRDLVARGAEIGVLKWIRDC